ncbi:DUF4113 domain-containing protein [Rathayibacter sp. VKM Ac-2857]|nr:DUF4113 domain-containing protein [Rathayibacter sp. VKM Ac-2857]NQX17941.1 DUF4113 domain-containing protein [Rathayibacter sp. VKM Ac-2857]
MIVRRCTGGRCHACYVRPTIDAVTKRHGRSAVGLGLAGIRKGPVWTMKRGALSLRATTHWGELATAHAR